MLKTLRNFAKADDGLVTVEWVALTAGMVIAAVAIGYAVMNNTKRSASKVGAGISGAITTKYGRSGSKL